MDKKIFKNLDTNFIARNVIYYKEIDSTQKEIWREVENNIENGTLILADTQTDGIGTHGRKWYTTQKNNIAFSFVVYPNVTIDKLDNLTTEIAETILEVFEELYNIKLQIKIPNDIMIGTRKLGGILTETKLKGNIVKSLVIGIGINTNQKYFENEIEDIATSIYNEFNVKVKNEDVIVRFCNKFEKKLKKRLGTN